MDMILGALVALLLAWGAHKLGTLVRSRTGIALSKGGAIAVGVVVAMGIWFALRYTTQLPQEFVNALGIGPAVGLGHSLQKPTT